VAITHPATGSSQAAFYATNVNHTKHLEHDLTYAAIDSTHLVSVAWLHVTQRFLTDAERRASIEYLKTL